MEITEKMLTDLLLSQTTSYKRGNPFVVGFAPSQRDVEELYLIYYWERNLDVARIDWQNGRLTVTHDYHRRSMFNQSLKYYKRVDGTQLELETLVDKIGFWTAPVIDIEYKDIHIIRNQKTRYEEFIGYCPIYQSNLEATCLKNQKRSERDYVAKLTKLQRDEIKGLVIRKQTAEAAKMFHEITGCGLIVAKEVVENHWLYL